MNKLIKWTSILTVLSIVIFGLVSHYVPEMLTTETEDTEEEPKLEGLKFTKIDDSLYTLTGTVREGDCRKIVPLLPKRFAVILESRGGSLGEGMCLASHFKIRDVITIVRDSPVINELGKEVYTPATIEGADGKVICASSCSLLFLGGDRRYLIGDVYLGIHGPRTPPEASANISKQAIEANAYRTSAVLLDVLKKLGVEDETVRMAFIAIPSTSMYWLRPTDFEAKPALMALATNYRNFWGFTGSIYGG
jgi:hypothetical protein